LPCGSGTRFFNPSDRFGTVSRHDRTEDNNYQGLLTCLGHPAIGMLLPAIPGKPAKITDKNGIERWECDMENNSFLGSPSGAKTTLDFTFIWPAVQQGLVVKDLCEALAITRLEEAPDGMRYEVRYKNHHTGATEAVQAQHVIVAAGGLNTTRLLLRSRDVTKGLKGMPRLGREFSGNGDFFGVWKENSDRDLSRGMPIAAPFRLHDSTNSRVIVLRAHIQGLQYVPAPAQFICDITGPGGDSQARRAARRHRQGRRVGDIKPRIIKNFSVITHNAIQDGCAQTCPAHRVDCDRITRRVNFRLSAGFNIFKLVVDVRVNIVIFDAIFNHKFPAFNRGDARAVIAAERDNHRLFT